MEAHNCIIKTSPKEFWCVLLENKGKNSVGKKKQTFLSSYEKQSKNIF